MENDAAPVQQDVAAMRAGNHTAQRHTLAALGDWRILQVSGKVAREALQGCAGADLLILNQVDDVQRPCEVYDLGRLRNTGSLAMHLAENGDLIIQTAHGIAGARPWNARQGAPQAPLILRVDAQKRVAEATRFFNDL